MQTIEHRRMLLNMTPDRNCHGTGFINIIINVHIVINTIIIFLASLKLITFVVALSISRTAGCARNAPAF